MNDLSLRQLLLPDFRNSGKIILDISETREDLEQVHKKVKTHLQEGQWSEIQDKLFSHLEELLNIPLASVLTNSWNKLYEISQTIKQQKQSGSTKPKTIPLFNHSIESTHFPKLQIYLNNGIIYTIPITVTLELDLKGVELVIAQGVIQEIKSGSCKGNGKITYKEAKLHERNILEFELPGSVSLVSNEAPENSQPTRQLGLLDQVEPAPEPEVHQNNWGWVAYVLLGIMFLVLGVLSWKIFLEPV